MLSQLAQSVERKALNLVVVGSSPTGGGFWAGFEPRAAGAPWCSGSTSDSKSDNGGSIPSEVTSFSAFPHGAVGSASGC